MPTDKIPSLPASVAHLINIEPTRSDVDAWVQRFGIANVLASPSGAHPLQQAYDLCSKLPDVADEGLKSAIPALMRIYGDNAHNQLAKYGFTEDHVRRANDVIAVCIQLSSLWEEALRYYETPQNASRCDVAGRLCLHPTLDHCRRPS